MISLGSLEEKFISPCTSIFEKIIKARTREFLPPLFPLPSEREASRKRASIFQQKFAKLREGCLPAKWVNKSSAVIDFRETKRRGERKGVRKEGRKENKIKKEEGRRHVGS